MEKLISNKSKILLLLVAVCSAIFFGLISLIFVNLVGDHYLYLFSIPAAIVIFLFFILDKYSFFAFVVISRSSLDSVLDSIKLGSFGLGALLNALVILIALLVFIEKPEKIDLKVDTLKVSWAIFLSLAFISIFHSPVLINSIKLFLFFVTYASMFYLGLSLVRSEDDFGKWMKAIFYSSLIPVMYGVFCLIFGGRGLRLSVGEGLRLQSTFNHPNSFSFYLVLVITICFYLYKTRPVYISTKLIKALPIYILTLLGLLIMTKTRAAWMASGLFFLLYGLLYERKFLITLFAMSLLVLLIPDVQDRVFDLQQGNEFGATGYERLNSYAWRKKYWADAIHWMDQSHYLFGYGLRSFMHYSTTFGMGNAHHKQTVEINAHSAYVQILFELGVLGLISFIYLMYSHLKKLVSLYNRNKLLIFTVIVILVEYLLAAYSDNLLDYLVYDWYLWFVTGLTMAYVSLKKTKVDN